MFFGGMPGGGFPGMPQKREPADTTKLYETLGIEKSSSAAQIKKAYRKKALRMHPDKGGDPEEFKKLQAAYDVLSDEDKRKTYDKYGLEGLEKAAVREEAWATFLIFLEVVEGETASARSNLWCLP